MKVTAIILFSLPIIISIIVSPFPTGASAKTGFSFSDFMTLAFVFWPVACLFWIVSLGKRK